MAPAFDFHQWILSRQNASYIIEEINERTIHLKTAYATAEIKSYPENTYEFSIRSNNDGAVTFYLHFALTNEDHAVTLFNELVASLLKQKETAPTKVLLCCSSGMTTNYFASKLNDSMEFLHHTYVFKAVSFNKVYELGFQYDIIVIAPQVAYLYAKIRNVLQDKLVLTMPAHIFAAYDVPATIRFLDEARAPFYHTPEAETLGKPRNADIRFNILAVGLLIDLPKTTLLYRLYKEGQPVETETTLRESTSLQDLIEIMDTQTKRHPDIAIICLSIPGTVSRGRLTQPFYGIEDYDLLQKLRERYHKRIIICNNSNAIVMALHAYQTSYHSLVYHSQPTGSLIAGEGIVIHDQLVTGKNGIAGEVQYLTPVMYFSDHLKEKIWTPEGMAEIIARELVSMITSIGPEAVFIRCALTPDMDMIRNFLTNYLPVTYIPDLIYVRNITEYLLTGELMMVIRELRNNNL